MFQIAMGEAVEKESRADPEARSPRDQTGETGKRSRNAAARPEFAEGGPGAAAERKRIILGDERI